MKTWKKTVMATAALLLLSWLVMLLAGYGYVPQALWYNFVNIDDNLIFDNRKVHGGTVATLPRSRSYNTAKVSAAMQAYHAEMGTVALVALHQDSLLHQEYFDGHDSLLQTNSFSMSKSVLALLVGAALQDGKLKSIDEPVARILPRFGQGMAAALTLRHLLSMSSGMNWNEAYSSLLSQTTEAYYGNNLQKVMDNLEVVTEPGRAFNYQSGNQLFIAEILKKATGQSLSSYLSEKLWKPLGASPATWSLDHAGGSEKAYCCLNTTAVDYARLGMLCLHHGRWQGRQLVDSAFLAEATAPAAITGEDGKPCGYYGLGFWLMTINHRGRPVPVYYMRGILGQYCMVVPQLQLVVVRLGRQRETKKHGEHYTDCLNYLRQVLDGYAL